MQTLRKYLTERGAAVFSIAAAFSWSYLIIALLNRNEYGFFALRSLRWLMLLFPAMLVGIVYASKKLRPATADSVLSSENRQALIASLAAAAAIYLLFPFPNPALVTEQRLVLISTGEKQASSAGRVVEVRAAQGLDGAELPLDRFQLSGDWRLTRRSLASEGRAPGASAEYRGSLGGGVVLHLRYNQDAGILRVIFNGVESSYDLYSEQGITVPVQIGAPTWQSADPAQKAWLALNAALSLAALTTLGMALSLASRAQRRPASVLVALLYLGLFAVFLFTKQMYPQFNAERAFRDTYSYVAHAELPLPPPRLAAE